MADIADVVGTWDDIGRTGSNVGGPVADTIVVQEPQREQAEVRLVTHIEKALIGFDVVGLS